MLFISALDGGEWLTSSSDHFTLAERVPGTHWIGGRVDSVEKTIFSLLPGIEHWPSRKRKRSHGISRSRSEGIIKTVLKDIAV
jgi:hypothetical protein